MVASGFALMAQDAGRGPVVADLVASRDLPVPAPAPAPADFHREAPGPVSAMLPGPGGTPSREAPAPGPGSIPGPPAPAFPVAPAPAPAPASREDRDCNDREPAGTDPGMAGMTAEQREPAPGEARDDDRDPAGWARDQSPVPGWRLIQREFPHLTESQARTAARDAKAPTQLRRIK
jgi:hypothetical protein